MFFFDLVASAQPILYLLNSEKVLRRKSGQLSVAIFTHAHKPSWNCEIMGGYFHIWLTVSFASVRSVWRKSKPPLSALEYTRAEIEWPPCEPFHSFRPYYTSNFSCSIKAVVAAIGLNFVLGIALFWGAGYYSGTVRRSPLALKYLVYALATFQIAQTGIHFFVQLFALCTYASACKQPS